MLKSYGKPIEKTDEFEFICLRNEDASFLFNNLRFELKDHNRAHISPGFISRTLVDRDFQHTINSLHFLISGHAVLSFQGKTRELSAGDVFLIGNHIKCSWEYTEPSEELTLLFNLYLGSFDDLFSSLSSPLVISKKEEDTALADALFGREDHLSLLALRNLSLGYVENFLRMSGTDLEAHVSVVKKYQSVFRYIEENLSASLSLDELARATNYSVGFFTKSFPRDNGLTVKEYIQGKIMSEVEQLLIYSDLSFRDISEKYGFCEQAYFTRWFKRQKGCTPSSYREQIRAITQNGAIIP